MPRSKSKGKEVSLRKIKGEDIDISVRSIYKQHMAARATVRRADPVRTAMDEAEDEGVWEGDEPALAAEGEIEETVDDPPEVELTEELSIGREEAEEDLAFAEEEAEEEGVPVTAVGDGIEMLGFCEAP